MRPYEPFDLSSVPFMTGTAPALDVDSLAAEPIEQFHRWIREAVEVGVPEATTVTFATVDADDHPDARTVILQAADEQGFSVAGHGATGKAAQVAAHPSAALNFWWQPALRAVRVRGAVSTAELPEGARLWTVRPERVEFWQGSPADQQHVRIVYTADAQGGFVREVTRG